MSEKISKKAAKNRPSNVSSVALNMPVVGIGASAGGLEAFKTFFEKMPVESGIAFVMIPHLDPGHKSLMVEIIARYTEMAVLQVKDGMKIERDQVYIVPPNRNLTINDGKFTLLEIPRNRGINLPVDIFFRSLAVSKKEQAIGVILSGTMRDGAMGLKDIKEHGGLVIAQSPKTAQHDGMPQSAIDTGMVDFVLPIEEMPDAIVKYVSHPYIHGETSAEDEDELNQVLAVIHSRTGHDFRSYKRNTLIRRSERRMGLRQIERMSDYIKVLNQDAQEADALLKDLLIGVTGFFREEQVWGKVRSDILPMMVKEAVPNTPIRVWIPACSTGEEAYTIALLIHDAFEKVNKHFSAQIFATDIDEEAIVTARRGIYPETIAAYVPAEYLKKYFSKEDGEYHVLRRVRESVVFAEQNLIGDAPFSSLNLISCRNLLIYLNQDIQQKIIELFHFSLQDSGCLVLGNSETIGYHTDLFETVSKEFRIYRRIGKLTDRMQIPIMGYTSEYHGNRSTEIMDLSRKDLSKLMQNQLLKRFAPAAVLIDKNNEIVNFFGPTSQYLDLPQGDPIMEITSMVKEGLRLKLRGAIHKAAKNDTTITVEDAKVKRDNKYHSIKFSVSPIKGKDVRETFFLVSFQDKPSSELDTAKLDEPTSGEENLVQQLEAELVDTREDLQNTIEELETSNEELKASNEEMMSMNEELQSSNEELETSKEELQSMNEEINTVNAELREKVQDLERANDDIANLMNSTEVATVFLDNSMAIRRFTPAAKKLFNLIPSDVGRPIGDLVMRFNDPDLKIDAAGVMENEAVSYQEVEADENSWYIRRILPFKTQDNRVDGLVLTFSDISEIKEKEKIILDREQKYRVLVENANSAILRWGIDGKIRFFNEYAQDSFGYDEDEIIGKDVGILVPDEDSGGNDLTELVKDLKHDPEKYKYNVNENVRKDGSRFWMAWTNKPIYDEAGNVVEMLVVGSDITALKNTEMALAASEKQKSLILENANDIIAYHDTKQNLVWANKAYLQATGKTITELQGNKCFSCWGLESLCNGCPVTLALQTGKPQQGELTPENQINWSEDHGYWNVRSAPVRDNEGNIIGAIEMAHDISEQKKAEAKLTATLEEKVVLLKEIHHRVKNNMQIISSLISLQANQLEQSDVKNVLKEMSNRVKSMAMVHEKLYQSEDLSSVDFAQYADNLLKHLWNSYNATSSTIGLKKDLQSIVLAVDVAVPLGLILNELMSNALQHAFKDDRQGEIWVRLKTDETDRTILVVGDNGVGFPANVDWQNSDSLGIRLIQMLAKQLNADVEINSKTDKGTEFKVLV